MSRNFEPILPLVPVEGLRLSVQRAGLYPGAPVSARAQSDGRVEITTRVQRRILGLIPYQRMVVLGHIGATATQIVTAALAQNIALRLRVVQLTPSHLSATALGDLAISIWADPLQLAPHLHVPTLYPSSAPTA